MSLLPRLTFTCLAFALSAVARGQHVAPQASAADRIVRNAEDYRAFVSADDRTPCTFDITGTVSTVRNPSFFVLDDGRERLPVKTERPTGAAPGDRVRVTGTLTRLSPDGKSARTFWHSLVADRVERIGRGTPPPRVQATVAEITQGRHYLECVETNGTVDEIVTDDVDPGYVILVLRDGADTVLVSLPSTTRLAQGGRGLVDAEVKVSGFCLFNLTGARKLTGWRILADDASNLKILRPPDENVATARRLRPQNRTSPETVAALGRRSARGRVLASWNGNRLLLKTDDGQLVPAELAAGEPEAAVGSEVEIVGSAETDLFRVTLSNARIKSLVAAPPETRARVRDRPLGPADLYRHKNGQTSFNANCFGRLFAAEGVVKSLPIPGIPASRLIIDCAGTEIPVAVRTADIRRRGVSTGARVRVTGILVFEADSWRPSRPFPRITSLFVATRSADDLVVTADAPFWTPGRFALALGLLTLTLVGILIWNFLLRRQVERRSQELCKAAQKHAEATLKTRERTRLAVELHDSIAQNLTGAALKIRSAVCALAPDDDAPRPHLALALKTVNASREELRNCIWDLRNRALEDPDFEQAIRATLEPVAGEARIRVRLAAARDRIPDTAAHAVLSIVRELASNAIRHGHASDVAIAGVHDGDCLRFSVKDDGCGFEPETCPGLEQGHFGLQGIRERAKTFDGSMTIARRASRGMRIAVSIKIPRCLYMKCSAPLNSSRVISR